MSRHARKRARFWQKQPPILALRSRASSRGPAGDAIKLKPIRIGLWDQYGGSMTSGWLRWIFEQFEFPFEVVYPAGARSGRSRQPFRCAGISERRHAARCPEPRLSRGGFFFRQPNPDDIPEEYRKMLGHVTRRQNHPAAPEVRRGRWNHRHHWRFHQLWRNSSDCRFETRLWK